MAKKINNQSGRIIEAVSIKDGYVEKTDEFWSAESLRKRPISEQYPKLENETESHYNDRIQKIQAYVRDKLSEEDKRKIENGAYTKKSGEAPAPNYKKFGMSALRTFDMATKNPDLLRSDEGKNDPLERQLAQENKANYYIDLYQKKQPKLSEFSKLVSSEKLDGDQSSLQKKEEEIEKQNAQKSLEERTKDKRMETWDRVAEVVLYPLALNFGLFDENVASPGGDSSGQRRAYAIYPSKFDDQFHGVDAAFMISTGVNKRGEIQYIPISFDCTTSTSYENIKCKFDNVSKDENGYTRIDYAKTEDGDLITNTRSLNFIIGIDHASMIGNKGLMRGNNIANASKAFIHDIYAQIYVQAGLMASYYEALLYERSKSKDARPVDVLSERELADARQVGAVRRFFERKCKETTTDKEHPFALDCAYDSRSPVFLVYEEAVKRLGAKHNYIKDIKTRKGWK